VITDLGDSGPVPTIDAASMQHMHAYGFNLILYLSTPTQIPQIRIIEPSDYRTFGCTNPRNIGPSDLQPIVGLKSSTQCVQVAAKSRRITGMTRRNFRRLDKQDFLIIYTTYTWPHLEYCVQSWSPHLIKDTEVLEKVQRAATKLVPELRKLEYNERLKRLGLATLQRRRTRGDLIATYKSSLSFFQLKTYEHGLRANNMNVFFSNQVVNDWNGLPQQVVDFTSINGFKNALYNHCKEIAVTKH